MDNFAMPGGDPAGLEGAAAALAGHAARTGQLASSARQSTASAASGWEGDASDSYRSYTGNMVSNVGSMEPPLTRVPGAVAGYAAALRTAQAKVGAFGAHTASASGAGPVSPAAAAKTQQMGAEAQSSLDELHVQAGMTAQQLRAIGEDLDHIFDATGPFREWLDKLTVGWSGSGGDALLAALTNKAEGAEDEYSTAKSAAEETMDADRETLKGIPAQLRSTWHDMLENEIDQGIEGNFEGPSAGDRFASLQDAVGTFTKGMGELPEEPALAGMLPALRAAGGVTSAAGLIGGAYTLAEPPEYDQGAARVGARIAGGAAVAGGGIGVGSSLGLIGGGEIASAAGLSLTLPGVGEAVGVGAGLYLAGDWAYHHTHQIAHTFDGVRHAAAHYADDAGHAIVSGAKKELSSLTFGVL